MSAGLYRIWCEQGATFTLPLVWKQADGTPVDLTGYSAQMDVRTSKTAETAVVELTTINGRITLGGATGEITLMIPATITATLDPAAYVYDLELIQGVTVYRILEGTFVVDGEVTR
jgi:hypothetical protein